jgi:3-phosphoshikimate 1-carboxyvinyltransferase
MNEYRVRKAWPIATELKVPGDKSISHRAVLLAALANGPSIITGFLPAEECLHTVQASRALGVKVDFLSTDDSSVPWLPDEKRGSPGPTRLRVHGMSMKLTAPSGAVDCGSSFTALSLLSGILAGQPFVTRLIAGDAVSRQPLKHLIPPLEMMGASIDATGPDKSTPLTITGSPSLKSVPHATLVAGPAAKGALLLAGLFASGKTTVIQPADIRDHTERLLRYYQVKTRREGKTISIYGGQMPESRDFHVPGDISYAANWITAAAVQPGSDLVVRGVGLNDTRTGYLHVLMRMGARIQEDIYHSRDGEPYGNLIVRGTRLRGTVISVSEVTAVCDELPLLAVAASLAEGRTVIHQTPAEATLISRIVHNLRVMGVVVSTTEHAIEITGSGGAALQPGCVPGYGDSHLAMAFAIAGLFTEGETIVENTACVDSTWPGFHDELRRFQERSIFDGSYTPVLSPVPAKKR